MWNNDKKWREYGHVYENMNKLIDFFKSIN